MMTYREYVLDRVNNLNSYSADWVEKLAKLSPILNENTDWETGTHLLELTEDAEHKAVTDSVYSYVDYLYYNR